MTQVGGPASALLSALQMRWKVHWTKPSAFPHWHARVSSAGRAGKSSQRASRETSAAEVSAREQAYSRPPTPAAGPANRQAAAAVAAAPRGLAWVRGRPFRRTERATWRQRAASPNAALARRSKFRSTCGPATRPALCHKDSQHSTPARVSHARTPIYSNYS